MLKRENYTQSHIMDIRSRTGSDPAIIERTVFAFGLLEAIAKTGMSFIFKGGTSIMMLLREPRRSSTDIDILVKPGTDIDEYMITMSHINRIAFPLTYITRIRLPMIIIRSLIIGCPILPDKILNEWIRAGSIIRRPGQGDDVLILRNGKTFNMANLVNVSLGEFAFFHGGRPPAS